MTASIIRLLRALIEDVLIGLIIDYIQQIINFLSPFFSL